MQAGTLFIENSHRIYSTEDKVETDHITLTIHTVTRNIINIAKEQPTYTLKGL